MEEYITRNEHDEFAKRIEAEDTRQNRRLEALEKSVEQNHLIAVNVERLAVSMESMVKEQERLADEQQNIDKRISNLESKDGDMWRSLIKYALAAAVGIIIGYIGTHIGF